MVFCYVGGDIITYTGRTLKTSELTRKIQIFCEMLTGRKFFPHQAQFSRRIIEGVLLNDPDTITSLMSRQSGKSFTVSATLSGLMVILPVFANMPLFADDTRLQPFKNGIMMGVFAPTLAQARIIFNNIKDFLSSKKAIEILESDEFNITKDTFNGERVTIVFNNLGVKSSITCFSASDGSNIEGGSYHLYVCDEAQDISNYKYRKSIFPTVSFYNGTKILIGTPSIKKNFFYDAIELNKKEYENGKKKRNHFEYDCDTIMKYNPKYAKTVEAAKKIMGENSIEFEMNYKLKWVFQFGMFIDGELFTTDPVADSTLDRMDYCKDQVCIAGIDVGKSQDSTVVTIGIPNYESPVVLEKATEYDAEDYVLYDIKIIDWLEIVGDNYEEQFYKVKDYLNRFNIKLCVIDGSGVGSPVADRLAANVDFPVIPFVFTPASKSMLMKNFSAYLNNKCFHYPSSSSAQDTIEYRKFQEQCLELTKDYRGDKLVVAAPKERNKHDDYPFSAALMVWGLKHDVGEVEVVDNNEFIQTTKRNIFVGRRNHRIRW